MDTLQCNAPDAADDQPADSSLLVADPDEAFYLALACAAQRRRITLLRARDHEEAVRNIELWNPEYIVADQRLPGGSSIDLIKAARKANRKAKLLVVTRCPSIACAVKAIKVGAWDYLAKPTTAQAVLDSLTGSVAADTREEDVRPLSVHRLEWEHIHRVLETHSENISATARALGMHRRTLQRKLSKYPTRW